MNAFSAKKLARTILYAVIAIVCSRVFGPISALLGYAAGAAVYKAMRKRDPDSKVPVIVGILSGLAVAFVVCVAAILLLTRLQ